jgi:endonuclease III
VSLCFFDWDSASEIAAAGHACVLAARPVFNNPRKLSAIVEIARIVERTGFAEIKRLILDQPVTELRRLPHVGQVTAWHLAKNLGLDVAKPDRHLARLAQQFGYADAHELCAALSRVTGEPVRVIDLVLWRYAAGGLPSAVPCR